MSSLADNMLCTCGHYPDEHWGGGGWCKECGCTWYHPHDSYIPFVRVARAAKDIIGEDGQADYQYFASKIKEALKEVEDVI